MAFCLAELHLWSTKNSLQVKDTDIGTYQYYDKGEPANPLEHHYYNEKFQFCEARGYSRTPKNRRPEKLRNSLKELEELLQSNTCIHTRWRSKYCCQMMLSNGVLVTVTLKGPQLDQVCVDRTLVGRLPANTVTDAVLSDRLVLLSFLEQSQVAGVYLNKKSQDSLETGRRTDKLSSSEIKVMCVEVGGPGGGLRRRVALSRLQDVALCWWTLDELSEGMWPWTPTDTHKNNLVLISCSPTEGLKLLCSVRTTGNPLDCCFSQLQHYQMLTVELHAGPQGLSADTCVYDCARGRLHRTSITSIPLPSPPLSCSRHPCETILVLGLRDSSLVLYDQRRAVSVLTPCPAPPSYMAWHPAGAVAIMVGGQEEVMCFDVGLAPLNMVLVAEEAAPAATLRLTQHLNCSGGLAGLQWGAGLDGGPEGTDMLTLVFNGGPVAALKFRLGALTGGQLGHVELLQQRLRCGQVREALGILEAMDWSTMADESYQGLSCVTNHLLRLPLNADREAQLEAALRVFYTPAVPLSDTVILEYREPVTKYARRLFHHLLRHQRFEKAFLLAVDLEARDLFMDLHYVAGDKGEVVLADVAKRKANEIEARAIAGDGVLQRGTSTACGSSLSHREPDGDPKGTGPFSLDNPPTQADERTGQRRPESIHVAVSPDLLRMLRQTGSSGGNREGGNDDEDLGMLHVVHLGMV
ncbi:WD repeat-containing and planar cell polarity effector protein fritz homolog isoform X1 [Poecilia reticulata]|nr:PREDICTED: WD repeat-containing and planar cell polarity effector protein fritz homolog isoform X1 [Poecilia reticulata]XP_017164685.1 PREDICTED: WD repeat-containing and planar cell polarity effector protein fritz homolog isoform X1 [Poecilia reticulata]XP_017164686.1 PREDICTED: WD repeat-containing and planar cell polarity effector protein fritz homolog isoform X1 [Poecilia reticulata]